MSASLRQRRDAHTVLIRMARDEARAERIRGLKGRYPDGDPSWAQIAQYVGVAERSAVAWQQTGEISKANAIKLAKFFQEKGEPIDDDYVWSGPKPRTPDLMGTLNGGSQLDRIEAKLDRLLQHFDLDVQTVSEAVEAFEAETDDEDDEQGGQAPPRPGRRAA